MPMQGCRYILGYELPLCSEHGQHRDYCSALDTVPQKALLAKALGAAAPPFFSVGRVRERPPDTC